MLSLVVNNVGLLTSIATRNALSTKHLGDRVARFSREWFSLRVRINDETV